MADGRKGVLKQECDEEPGAWWVQVGGPGGEMVLLEDGAVGGAVRAAWAATLRRGSGAAADEGEEPGPLTGKEVWGYFPEGRWDQRGAWWKELKGGWVRGTVGAFIAAPAGRKPAQYMVGWADEPEEEMVPAWQVMAMGEEGMHQHRGWGMDSGTRALINAARKMQGGELQAALKALQLPLGGLREVKRQRLAAAYALRAAGAAAVVEDSLLLKRIGLARFDPVAGAGRARQTPRGAALKRRAEMAIANGRALRHGGLMQAWKPAFSRGNRRDLRACSGRRY
jgi:hypothetical protein